MPSRHVIPTVLLLALLTLPAAIGRTARVEGESGLRLMPDCAFDFGSGEFMSLTEDSLFYPGAGCSAAYVLPGTATSATFRFMITGFEPILIPMCGQFVVSGTAVGATAPVCAVGRWVEATALFGGASPPESAADVAGQNETAIVTWVPQTERRLNAYLDWISFEVR